MMSTAFRITAAGVLILAACVPASAQDGLPYDIVQESSDPYGLWGDSIVSGNDVDLDGLDDILVFDPGYLNGLEEQVGKWHMYSGADGMLLWDLEGMHPLTGWNGISGLMCAAFIGDVDGDKAPDIVVGVPEGKVTNGSDGYVAILSGLTGDLIQIWYPDTPGQYMGMDVCLAGDVNSDSIPDFAYVERRWEDGLVTVRSGADLSVIKFIDVRWPRRIRCAGDINNDKRDDLAVASWCSSECDHALLTKVYSGALDSEVLLKLYPPKEDQSKDFGYGLAAGCDVTGDGVPDLLVSGRRGFYVYLFSGATGRIVTYFSDGNESFSDSFGMQLAFADFNGDGNNEIAAWGPLYFYLFDVSGQRLFYQEINRDIHGWYTGNEHAIGNFNGDECTDYVGDVEYNYRDGRDGYHLTLNGGGRLLLSTECPTILGRGTTCTMDVYGDRPGRQVYLYGSKIGNDCTFVDRLGICMDLAAPMYLLGTAITGPDRMAHIETSIGYGAVPGFRWLQAIDPNHPEYGPIKSNVWRVWVN